MKHHQQQGLFGSNLTLHLLSFNKVTFCSFEWHNMLLTYYSLYFFMFIVKMYNAYIFENMNTLLIASTLLYSLRSLSQSFVYIWIQDTYSPMLAQYVLKTFHKYKVHL